jgi:hypothetical protein
MNRTAGMCILPINIVNQKIFLGCWFLFILLILLSPILISFIKNSKKNLDFYSFLTSF